MTQTTHMLINCSFNELIFTDNLVWWLIVEPTDLYIESIIIKLSTANETLQMSPFPLSP